MKPLLLIAVLLLPSICRAQATDQVDDLREDQIFNIVIHAVPPSRPALQHRLFPAPEQQLNRNAAVYYHRAASRLRSIRSGIREQNLRRQENPIPELNSDSNDERWMDSSLAEMPVDEMRTWVERHRDVFADLQRARISQTCNWGILPDISEDIDPYTLNMFELQQMRAICRMLVVAIRVAAAEKDFVTAIDHLQTGYKIAHDVGQCRSIVSTLVGVACARIIMQQQTMLMQQPNCPNLYWPLVDMPMPLTDVRSCIRNELGWMSGPQCLLKSLRDPENTKMTIEGWRDSFASDFHLLHQFGGMDEAHTRWALGVLAIRGYPIAKRALAERGMDAEEVRRMPVLQALAIHETAVHEIFCQELLKTLNLPYSEMIVRTEELQEKLEISLLSPSVADINSVQEISLLPYLPVLIPAISQVVEAEAGSCRSLMALRTIEALRAHVAESGELPAQLNDITVVPVPLNPATGEPFSYERNSSGATLKDYGFSKYLWQHYQIKLAK